MLLLQTREKCLKVAHAVCKERSQLNSQSTSRWLRILPLQAVIKVVCVAEDTDSFDARDRLPEDFQSLLAQLDRVEGHACHVAARSREALDGPAAHEVARRRNHDWNA